MTRRDAARLWWLYTHHRLNTPPGTRRYRTIERHIARLWSQYDLHTVKLAEFLPVRDSRLAVM